MAQDIKEYPYNDLCFKTNLETEVNSTKMSNLSFMHEIIKNEDQIITREQEINYSLSKLIKNLRIESDEISSLQMTNGAHLNKYCSHENFELDKNLSSSNCNEKSKSRDSTIKTEDNEISYALSDELKKLNIRSDPFFPSKMENRAHKLKIYSNKHCYNGTENSVLPAEGSKKILEIHDSNTSIEKCYETAEMFLPESNVKKKYSSTRKCNSSNPIHTQLLSKKETSPLFKSKYSNKNESPTHVKETISCENDGKSEMAAEKYKIELNKIKLCAGKIDEELARDVHEASRQINRGLLCKGKEITCGTEIHGKMCQGELKSTQSLKKENKIINCSYVIEDKESLSNEETITEKHQNRTLICNCILNKRIELEESDEDLKIDSQASVSDQKNNDNDNEIVNDECDENRVDESKKSSVNQEKGDEESKKSKEKVVEVFSEYRKIINEDSDEEKVNIDEESDEDQEDYIEELGDKIRPHGPMKTLHKTHDKKPYVTKCETHNSGAFETAAFGFSSERTERCSSSSETQSDDNFHTFYADSDYTSSPSSSTNHSLDDLEENSDGKILSDELFNSVGNLFDEQFSESYSTIPDENVNQCSSYEDTIRLRSLIANEILENVFDNENSITDFSKLSIRDSPNCSNYSSSMSDDLYNKSLREMFDNEAILRTVEANVNASANLFPSKNNFHSPEIVAFTTSLQTNTLSPTHTGNSNFKELFPGSGTFCIENLNSNNFDKMNLIEHKNNKEWSPRSLSDNIESKLQNAQKKTACNSANSNLSIKSALPNKIRTKKNCINHSSTNTFSKLENRQIPLKCKDANGVSKRLLRSILNNDRLLLALGKYYKRIQDSKDIIYVTELRDSEGKHLNLTNLHIAVINSDLEEIYAIVEIQKQYNKTYADINRKDSSVFKKTALDYAIENGNQIVIDYLIENTAKQSIVIVKKTA